jgi:hypothetical protein
VLPRPVRARRPACPGSGVREKIRGVGELIAALQVVLDRARNERAADNDPPSPGRVGHARMRDETVKRPDGSGLIALHPLPRSDLKEFGFFRTPMAALRVAAMGLAPHDGQRHQAGSPPQGVALEFWRP